MASTDPDNGIGSAPGGAARRELIRRGHGLKSQLAIGRAGLSDAFLAQVRQSFTNADLLKVRLEADTPGEAEDLAEELAARVPCHFVQRVGRVALMYRPRTEN
jgi:RNA-binding protein